MNTAKTILNLTLALTISALIGLSQSGAASRVTEDLTDMVKMAGAVAEVTVTAQRVQADNANSVPFTVVTLKIEKVFKGQLDAGNEIQAEYMGGAAFGRMVVSPGQANLKMGDRAVLLLTKAPNAANFRILGGDAGQITLSQDGEGRQLARRGSGRFSFYVADEAALTGYRQVNSSAIYSNQLNALLTTLTKIGRPVLENEYAAEAKTLPAPAAMTAAAPASDDSSLFGRLLSVLFATTLVWAASRYFLNRAPRAATI